MTAHNAGTNLVALSRDVLRSLLQQSGVGKLRDTGNGFQFLCPFHDNRRTPAAGMNLEGLWNCMNPACAEKGNLTTFLMRVMNMPMAEAMKYAPAREADLDYVYQKMPAYDKRAEVAQHEYVPDARLDVYRRCPQYMLDRGYPMWFLKGYEIGWDPDCEWPDKTRRAAVTFPVRDHETKRLLGFTRRAVEEAFPQYSHEVEKNRTLYLLHRIGPGPVLVTEGPCDALTARLRALEGEVTDKFTELALSNAVATMGGKFSDAHVPILGRQARPVVLGFDNDVAGFAAREKAVELLMEGGVTDLHVLDYPGKDLGDLGEDQTAELSCVPTWKRHLRR